MPNLMQSPSSSSSPDRWELVIEDEVIDLPCVPVHQNPVPLADSTRSILTQQTEEIKERNLQIEDLTAEISKLTQARWRRFVLRLLVRRHGAYLMLLAKGWRKKK